jgi:putative transposase
VSELREIRQLRDENARLKRVVADLTLDKHILSEVIRKKGLKPARRRELVTWIQETFKVSTVRSCRLAQFTRAAWYRKSTARGQRTLALRTRNIAHARPRFGYQRIT